MSPSLAISAAHGFIRSSEEDSAILNEHLLALKGMNQFLCCPLTSFLVAIEKVLLLYDEDSFPPFHRAHHLVVFLIDELKAEWWRVNSLNVITEWLLSLDLMNEMNED